MVHVVNISLGLDKFALLVFGKDCKKSSIGYTRLKNILSSVLSIIVYLKGRTLYVPT